MYKKGFTLIELLIVIALLGSLAVALLAAIDPFEQFKKGADTGVRNTVQEYFNAGIRYYAQKSAFPTTWGITPTIQITARLTSNPTQWITPLVDAGELKGNFIDLSLSSLSNIYVAVLDSKLQVCFIPSAKSFQFADPNTKYTAPGFDSAGNPFTDPNTFCKVNSPTGADCYWCIQ